MLRLFPPFHLLLNTARNQHRFTMRCKLITPRAPPGVPGTCGDCSLIVSLICLHSSKAVSLATASVDTIVRWPVYVQYATRVTV